MDRIHYWKGKIQEAQHALSAAISGELPIGCTVHFQHGRRTRQGTVINNEGVGDLATSVQVRGVTGAVSWVSVWNIIRRVD
jgi:hypothetical protein